MALFITNNSSVRRKHVVDLGLFDEGIVRYGFEDYDLGIRLHQAGLTFRPHRDIVSVHQEHPSNCKSVDDIRANIAYMCDKYNNIRSLDVHLAFNGPFPPDMTNGIMTDIHKLLESQKYDMPLNLFLESLHVVKERNIDPDWQKKAPRVTAKTLIYKLSASFCQKRRKAWRERFCQCVVCACQRFAARGS